MARTVLNRRHPEAGLNPPQKPARKSLVIEALLTLFDPEIKAWRGEQPLARVFWGYGVLTNLGIAAVYWLSFYDEQIALQQALLMFIVAYMVWLLVSIWRSSTAADNPLWGTLARHLVVVWTGNTIMVVIFLELNLIGRYFSS
jgi:hypothetical protein